VPLPNIAGEALLMPHQFTSGEHFLHMAAADSAPKFGDLVQNIAERIHGDGLLNSTILPVSTVLMHEHNGDWDILYPYNSVS
jgi:hypothetical protein